MFKGFYFDGNSSEKQEVELQIDHLGAVRLIGEYDLTWPFDEITISPRIGNSARYISFPNGEQFETTNNDAVDAFVKKFGADGPQGFIYRFESTKSIVFATVVVVIIISWGLIQYGVPYFSRTIAFLLPPEATELLGQGVLNTLDSQILTESKLDQSRQAELQELFESLIQQTNHKSKMQLELRGGGPIRANALALPDGSIVFTDELVGLATDDGEIAAILLHEIGHLEYRHSIRTALQQFSLAMFVMAITGDVSTSSSVITALPLVLVKSGFSREMELEADGYALITMLQLRIDPNHFANIMEKLEASRFEEGKCEKQKNEDECLKKELPKSKEVKNEEDKTSFFDYFSTHPVTQDRINRFRQAAKRK